MKDLALDSLFVALVAAMVMCVAALCSVHYGPGTASQLNVAKRSLVRLSVAAPDVGGEFTSEYARLNGIDCPVYRRKNGTYFAIAGESKIDVDRVEGHARRDGVVRAYYRTRRDGVADNNLSANLHGANQ